MTLKEARRAAIYIRVSKAREGMVSPEIQEAQTRALAERSGWTVVDVYKDIDISGASTANRPGLKALRGAYDRKDFEVAVAHSVSRFSRDMQDGAEIIGEMPIATVLEGEAPPDDDFVPLLHMLLAHKQRKEISKRWREAQALRISQGKPKDGVPRFGYVNSDKNFVPDPVTGPELRDAYLGYVAGLGFPALAARMNERKINTTRGGPITVTYLMRALDSGFGAGLIKSGDDLLPGAHDAVITDIEWRRYKKAREMRKQQPAKVRGSRWFLAGLVRCGKCGALTVVNSYDAENSQVLCSTYKMQGRAVCSGVWYQRKHIESEVNLWLEQHLAEWAAAMPDDSTDRQVQEGRLEAAGARLESLDEQAGRLTRGWSSGVLDDAGYRLALVNINAERAEAVTERDAAQDALDALVPTEGYEHIFDFLLGKGDGEPASPAEENAVLRKILDRIEVHDDEIRIVDSRGAITPRAKIREVRAPQERGTQGRYRRSDRA